MPDIGLSFSVPSVLILTGIVLSALLSFLAYRSTTPPLAVSQRVSLGLLRFGSFSLLVVLLARPVLSLVGTTFIPPLVVVMADNSASMSLADASRGLPSLRSALEATDALSLDARAEVVHLLFDQRVRVVGENIADSLTLSGDVTDISSAFAWVRGEAREKNIRAAILLSDGNHTAPSQPVAGAVDAGVPVFTVGIGDTAARRDLAVSDILTNSLAYAGTRVPVRVTLRSDGFDGERAEISLRVQGRTTDRASVVLTKGTGEYRTTLYLQVDSAGLLRGDVVVSTFDDEVTHRNNSARFSLRVLSGKRRIVILAGSPSEDLAFVRRTLAVDSNMTVDVFIERPGGGFLQRVPSETDLRNAHALFLIGFPGQGGNAQSLNIARMLSTGSKPTFLLLSRTMGPEQIRQLGQAAPFSMLPGGGAEQQVLVSVSERAALHPVMRVSPEGSWSTLPPIYAPRTRIVPSPEAVVLAHAVSVQGGGGEPLIIARTAGGVRSLALSGYGIWRWKMLSPRGGDPGHPFDAFIANAVRWLTAVDDERRFRVAPSRDIFSTLEAPLFRAEVYDEGMHPVSDARIALSISGEAGSFTSDLVAHDNGQYEASFDVLPPGTYSYAAVATLGAERIGADSGSFDVGGLQAEFLETRMNRDLLRSIAFRTGGAYVDADDIGRLDGTLDSLVRWETVARSTATTVELWFHPWVLALIVLLLTLEWLFRKRWGML